MGYAPFARGTPADEISEVVDEQPEDPIHCKNDNIPTVGPGPAPWWQGETNREAIPCPRRGGESCGER